MVTITVIVDGGNTVGDNNVDPVDTYSRGAKTAILCKISDGLGLVCYKRFLCLNYKKTNSAQNSDGLPGICLLLRTMPYGGFFTLWLRIYFYRKFV